MSTSTFQQLTITQLRKMSKVIYHVYIPTDKHNYVPVKVTKKDLINAISRWSITGKTLIDVIIVETDVSKHVFVSNI